jgi:hypothetical protein
MVQFIKFNFISIHLQKSTFQRETNQTEKQKQKQKQKSNTNKQLLQKSNNKYQKRTKQQHQQEHSKSRHSTTSQEGGWSWNAVTSKFKSQEAEAPKANTCDI